MGSIDKRIENLERLVGPPEDEAAERRRSVVREILDEFAALKASRAVHYRAGVRVEPEDIPGTILGPDYTTEQLWELAAKRVFEREDRRGA
jgi:hypothetical protein